MTEQPLDEMTAADLTVANHSRSVRIPTDVEPGYRDIKLGGIRRWAHDGSDYVGVMDTDDPTGQIHRAPPAHPYSVPAHTQAREQSAAPRRLPAASHAGQSGRITEVTQQFPWLVEGARLVSVGLSPLSLTEVRVTSIDPVFAYTAPVDGDFWAVGPMKFWATLPNEKFPGSAKSTGGGHWALLPSGHPAFPELQAKVAELREQSRLAEVRNGVLVTRACWQWLYDDVDSQHDKQVRTHADAQALIDAAQQWIEASPDAG